jgi:hypothetical protein
VALRLLDPVELDEDLWLIGRERRAGLAPLQGAARWDPADGDIIAAVYLDRERWDLYRDAQLTSLFAKWKMFARAGSEQSAGYMSAYPWIPILATWPAVGVHVFLDTWGEGTDVSLAMMNARVRRIEWVVGPTLTADGRRRRGLVPIEEDSPEDPTAVRKQPLWGKADPLPADPKQLPPEKRIHAGGGIDSWRSK